mmetsp:Transcript_44778/g.126474  ORF Transcript_44778/g.126474 Transcript_44778/m.126474 type:complete len:242 (-) Transcript_44778:1285-2010(-)
MRLNKHCWAVRGRRRSHAMASRTTVTRTRAAVRRRSRLTTMVDHLRWTHTMTVLTMRAVRVRKLGVTARSWVTARMTSSTTTETLRVAVMAQWTKMRLLLPLMEGLPLPAHPQRRLPTRPAVSTCISTPTRPIAIKTTADSSTGRAQRRRIAMPMSPMSTSMSHRQRRWIWARKGRRVVTMTPPTTVVPSVSSCVRTDCLMKTTRRAKMTLVTTGTAAAALIMITRSMRIRATSPLTHRTD